MRFFIDWWFKSYDARGQTKKEKWNWAADRCPQRRKQWPNSRLLHIQCDSCTLKPHLWSLPVDYDSFNQFKQPRSSPRSPKIFGFPAEPVSWVVIGACHVSTLHWIPIDMRDSYCWTGLASMVRTRRSADDEADEPVRFSTSTIIIIIITGSIISIINQEFLMNTLQCTIVHWSSYLWCRRLHLQPPVVVAPLQLSAPRPSQQLECSRRFDSFSSSVLTEDD